MRHRGQEGPQSEFRSAVVRFGRRPVAFGSLDRFDRIAHPVTDPHERRTDPLVSPTLERSRTDSPPFSDFSARQEQLQFGQGSLLC